MKFEPIKDDLLGAFEADCAAQLTSESTGAPSVLMKYLGQTIARVRKAEARRDELEGVLSEARLAFDLDDLSDFTHEQASVIRAICALGVEVRR